MQSLGILRKTISDKIFFYQIPLFVAVSFLTISGCNLFSSTTEISKNSEVKKDISLVNQANADISHNNENKAVKVVKNKNYPPIKGLDLQELSEEQKQTFYSIAEKELCYDGCPGTILGCLLKPEGSLQSLRMAKFIVREIRDSQDAETISDSIVNGFGKGFHSTPFSFKLSDQPFLGNKNAKVIIVEFADFRCGHCALAHLFLTDLLKTQKDKVKLYFKYYPLNNNESSIRLAMAAEAAKKQQKFWEMHDMLFSNQESLVVKESIPDEDIFALAQKVGLNIKKFKKDFADPRTREAVLDSKQEGMASEVGGTPSFYIHGRPFGFRHTMENFIDRIEMELERKP